MTLVTDDIATARRAVAGLERAARTLVEHFGDTLDARRLLADVGRLSSDLDLLCGAPAPAPPPAAPTPREVIPDTSYTHDFWMDAEDEGVGRWSTPGR
jgi:hypothetical protein